MSQGDWESLVKQWFPHLTHTRLRQVTWPDFDRHRDYIVEMLRAGVTKATIHQRLRDGHQVTGSLASFKRYVAANLAEDAVREKGAFVMVLSHSRHMFVRPVM